MVRRSEPCDLIGGVSGREQWGLGGIIVSCYAMPVVAGRPDIQFDRFNFFRPGASTSNLIIGAAPLAL